MKLVQVSFGHQRRRTKIGRLQSRRFTADAGLPFASTVPMKPRNFKLLLCEVDRERKRSQLVAIAFIPLADIMHKSEALGLAHPNKTGRLGAGRLSFSCLLQSLLLAARCHNQRSEIRHPYRRIVRSPKRRAGCTVAKCGVASLEEQKP